MVVFKGRISGPSFLRTKMYANTAATMKMAIRTLESTGSNYYFLAILHYSLSLKGYAPNTPLNGQDQSM